MAKNTQAESDEDVRDDAAWDDTVALEAYNITSFGADYDVEGIVRRLQRKDLLIPEFQREYVWGIKEASRFVESLLLGLPVPGVFLAKEPTTNKLLVIDGQQRLKSLQFFYEGYFAPEPDDKSKRVFGLTKVQPQFDGRTYETLREDDRVKLNDSIIHATIVKQESPAGDDTSIYHIFERLNYGGRRLYPQEIRVAVYHGSLVDRIQTLNEYKPWRDIYGKKHLRLKDSELLLRYVALLHREDKYEAPMAEFLSKFAGKFRDPADDFLDSVEREFKQTIDTIAQALGAAAFRPERALNAAVFDAVMVAITRRLRTAKLTPEHIAQQYGKLLSDSLFLDATLQATSDGKRVHTRIARAEHYFAQP